MISSDDVDSIRNQLYELRDEIVGHVKTKDDHLLRKLEKAILDSLDIADDLRIDALDSEDEEEWDSAAEDDEE